MRPGNLGDLGAFGQGPAAAAVLVAAGEVAVNAVTAVKEQRIHRKFSDQFRSDEQKMDYIRNLVLRYSGVGRRLTSTTSIRPGTTPFEQELQKRLQDEMLYRGKCNADLYLPRGPKDRRGQPRKIIGKFYRSGYLDKKAGRFPKDAGPVWAGGCKNAQDDFRISYLKKRKGTGKFSILKAQAEDIGTVTLFLKVGMGFLMIIAMGMAIRAQRKVIAYETK